MIKVSEEVIAAAAEMGCKAVRVDHEVMTALRLLVRERFTDGWNLFPMWEHLNCKSSVFDSTAWSWVGEYIGNNQAIMFFESGSDKSGVLFEDGSSVFATLGNSGGFVFYLTDTDVSYVLCFNDHDFLIACGAATDWIERKKELGAP